VAINLTNSKWNEVFWDFHFVLLVQEPLWFENPRLFKDLFVHEDAIKVDSEKCVLTKQSLINFY
jgi:hypothetical protein